MCVLEHASTSSVLECESMSVWVIGWLEWMAECAVNVWVSAPHECVHESERERQERYNESAVEW